MNYLPTIRANATATQHSFLLGLKTLLALWIRNQRTRKTLNGLEEHRLQGVGVDRAKAAAEECKPFWK